MTIFMVFNLHLNKAEQLDAKNVSFYIKKTLIIIIVHSINHFYEGPYNKGC